MSTDTRTPGQRPDWCLDDQPEEPMTETATGAEVVTWSRYFAPKGASWDVGIFAEDRLSLDGLDAGPTFIRVFDPECDLTPDEAEQFALAIVDAVKAAQSSL